MSFKTICVFFYLTSTLSLTAKADCYTEYNWCSNLAEYFFAQNLYFDNSNAEQIYMRELRACFGELVD